MAEPNGHPTEGGEITGRRSIIVDDVSLSPLSNSILEGSSGASVTNGRSVQRNDRMCTRGRLKPISGGGQRWGRGEEGRFVRN